MTSTTVAASEVENKEQAENCEEDCLDSASTILVSRGRMLYFLASIKEEVRSKGDKEALDGFVESLAAISHEINCIAVDLERESSRVYKEFKAVKG